MLLVLGQNSLQMIRRHLLMNARSLYLMELETSHVSIPNNIVDFTYVENILSFVLPKIYELAHTDCSRESADLASLILQLASASAPKSVDIIPPR